MDNFERVVGYEDIKAELRRFADVIRNTEKYASLGVTLPSGLLLSGKPGLGKTLMAKCFIEEAGCKTFTLRKDKPNGDFVKHIRETFDEAKKEAPSIVFLDDMDKFANEDRMHRDAEEYVTIQSCIDDNKGCGIFVLATVNEKYDLPDSLLRAGRFDETIDVEPPRGEDAEELIKYFLSTKTMMGNVDMEELTRLMEGNSCAEIETIINKAGIYAVSDGRDRIDQGDIVKACMRLMFESPECVNPSNNGNTKSVAIHEAGHAVVAEVLDPGSVTLTSVCRHIGQTEGVTKVHKREEFDLSKELYENSIICALGGKAATEMILGVADMGCNSDMHKVFDSVAVLVDNNCTLGFDAFERNPVSNYVLDNKDRLISSEVERYYKCAKKIVAENREFLDAVISALLDHKTVTFREMQTIREQNIIVQS